MRSPVFRRRVSATCGDGGGAPRKCHPGGGGRLSSHHTTTRYTADTQYTILGATAPHPSGVRFGGCPSAVPACRHDPAWRNTGLRTAATPRGVAKMSASGHHLHIVHITASRYRVPPPSQLRLAPRRATLHRAAPHHHAPPLAPRSAARASPCRTAPPRHLTMRYRVPHCTTRRQLSPPPAELHCNAV